MRNGKTPLHAFQASAPKRTCNTVCSLLLHPPRTRNVCEHRCVRAHPPPFHGGGTEQGCSVGLGAGPARALDHARTRARGIDRGVGHAFGLGVHFRAQSESVPVAPARLFHSSDAVVRSPRRPARLARGALLTSSFSDLGTHACQIANTECESVVARSHGDTVTGAASANCRLVVPSDRSDSVVARKCAAYFLLYPSLLFPYAFLASP